MTNETPSVRVAAVQMRSGTDVEKNLHVASELVHTAADQGATYIQLPEYFNYYGSAKHFVEVAQDIPGAITRAMSEIARERHVTLHLGSMLQHTGARNRSANTSVVLGDDGEIVALYQKTHLFDIDVPGEVSYRESAAIAAGSELVVADVNGFTLGLSICFDVRFAELYRQLALRGATVFAVPAAFSAVTGPAHWEVLLRARAIENHAFVVAATQAGTTDEGLATYGHAMVIDPWGSVLAQSSGDAEQVVLCDIDLSQVARRRREIDVLALRRPDLYGERDPNHP